MEVGIFPALNNVDIIALGETLLGYFSAFHSKNLNVRIDNAIVPFLKLTGNI